MGRKMQTKTMIRKIASTLFFSFLLSTCAIVTITGKVMAEQAGVEVPLTVKGVEGDVAIFHTIKVQVGNLEQWIAEPGHDPSKLILYIDGNAVKGLQPALVENNTRLQFDLKRLPENEENKNAWIAILSRGPRSWTRQVPITVGFENGIQVPSTVKAKLTVINEWWFRVFVISFLAAIALFWWLAFKSDIIRDTGPQPKGKNSKGKPNRKPYSLARAQMACWFFVVIISYVFIWMVTSDPSSLTPSVLGLIGISATTGLGSAVIDSNKRSEQANQHRILEEKKNSDEVEAQSLQSEISTLAADLAATPPPANLEEKKAAQGSKQAELVAKLQEIDQVNQQIQKLAAVSRVPVSKSFISDLLSDDDGVSFHRFQIFTWTIVLMFIFIGSVYNILAMPDFDATLLGLMGISGGTYIGFKLPEQQG
jgi:LEA14-like dessication related protein